MRSVRSLPPNKPLTDPAPPRRSVCAPEGVAVAITRAGRLQKETVTYVASLDPEFPEPEFAPHADPTPHLAAPAADDAPVNPRSSRRSDGSVVYGFVGPE